MRRKDYGKVKALTIILVIMFITATITWQVSVRTFSGDKYLLSSEQYARFNKYQKIDEIIAGVNEKYYKDIDENALIEGAFEGVVGGIGDPYSEYLTKEEIEEVENFNKGTFSGIGITFSVSKEAKYPIIQSVISKSPAEKAGLKAGDYIVAVDDISTKNLTSDKIVAMVTGKKGTKVKLSINRNNSLMEFDVERAEIESEVMTSKVIDGKIGYVRLSSFTGKSADKVIKEFKSMAGSGCTNFILDLRNNGGGLVDEAVKLCDFFMPHGQIVYTKSKDGVKDSYESDSANFGKPVIVLVNEYTASASEIVSGALKHSKTAKLVGTNTYGKGVVQSFFPLTDGNSSLKLTTAVYYFANGETPNEVGVKPDYEVQMDDLLIGNDEKDVQLKKAIELCK